MKHLFKIILLTVILIDLTVSQALGVVGYTVYGTLTATNELIHNTVTIEGMLNITTESKTGGIILNRNGRPFITNYGTTELFGVSSNIFIGTGAGTLDAIAAGSTSNYALGYNALRSINGGHNNVAIGGETMELATTTSGNVAIGGGALRSITTMDSTYNVGIGSSALQSYTGSHGCAVGFRALYQNTTGSGNVGIGSSTGYNTTTGGENLFVGTNAGYTNVSGQQNTYLGGAAGFLSTGSNNVFVGYTAGYNEVGSNKLYIANSNTSSPLVYGDFTASSLIINGKLTTTGIITAESLIVKNDCTIEGNYYGNKALILTEMSTVPASVPVNNVGIYAEDFKGFTLLSFRDDTGMVRKIVRDSVFVGKNDTASTITIGSPVYASGSSDNVPTIALALASTEATMPAIGIVIENITAGSFGRVMQVGLLENFNTTAFTSGDVVYVSGTNAGSLTSEAPTYPKIRQEMGTILIKGTGNGAMQCVARSQLNENIINHSGLLGLTNDDHPQYLGSTETAVAANYATLSGTSSSCSGNSATANYAIITGTASNVATNINIETSGYITADSFVSGATKINGNIITTGYVTATSFAGNGAALTGLPSGFIPKYEQFYTTAKQDLTTSWVTVNSLVSVGIGSGIRLDATAKMITFETTGIYLISYKGSFASSGTNHGRMRAVYNDSEIIASETHSGAYSNPYDISNSFLVNISDITKSMSFEVTGNTTTPDFVSSNGAEADPITRTVLNCTIVKISDI